ncbi:hypothetical protein [Empedobacter tilapiae]|uniref:Uncharacterized protein n=1 Tax=Empedobacter tilapiae TaxID=2491114 RepID=A0A4Z1B4D8_9FLAO|nr:hypothetical protein [Empedobacter tilapiae]TGN21937.1 hypothetical protein E4J94_16735 [Empedobacter tilapiae]
MEVLFEIILVRFMIRFLGVNTRYYFLKFFNKRLTKEDLTETNEDTRIVQDIYNAFIGLVMFCILFLGGAYLLDLLGLL